MLKFVLISFLVNRHYTEINFICFVKKKKINGKKYPTQITKLSFSESPLVASNGLLKEKHCRKGKESQSVSSPPQFPFTSKQYNTSEFCWRNYQQQTFVSSKQQCYTHYICAVLNGWQFGWEISEYVEKCENVFLASRNCWNSHLKN